MKFYEELKELIDNEIGDYNHYEDREIFCEDDSHDIEYYRLVIKRQNSDNVIIADMRFRCRKDKIEVCISDCCDKWEETDYFSHLVKWFWIALLS